MDEIKLGDTMRKIILFLILFGGAVWAQDTSFTVTTNLTDTLTTTIDSVQVTFEKQYNVIVLTAYTLGTTDTIFVETMDIGNQVWSKKALVDMSTTAPYTNPTVSATKTSFYVFDPKFRTIRVYTADTDTAAVIFNIGGR